MPIDYVKEFLFSLLATLAVEIPVTVLLVRYVFRKKEIKKYKIIFVGIIATVLTLPYLWFVLPFYVFDGTVYLIIGEGLVVIIEALVYYQFLELKFTKALILSLVANFASFSIGLLL